MRGWVWIVEVERNGGRGVGLDDHPNPKEKGCLERPNPAVNEVRKRHMQFAETNPMTDFQLYAIFHRF